MSRIINYEWEFNIAGIYNYKLNNGELRHYFDWVRTNVDKIPGDLVEAGVFRGKSLLGMAMMLKELGSEKKVYGFDTFSGFPPQNHRNDDLDMFLELYKSDVISRNQYDQFVKHLKLKTYLDKISYDSHNISSSGNFSDTNMQELINKINYYQLDNIVLVEGDFKNTMRDNLGIKRIMGALIDCDLYEGYVSTLDYCWSKLEDNGMIYLDEYYSLKFPGGIIATNEFLKLTPEAKLQKHSSRNGEFERYSLKKLVQS